MTTKLPTGSQPRLSRRWDWITSLLVAAPSHAHVAFPQLHVASRRQSHGWCCTGYCLQMGPGCTREACQPEFWSERPCIVRQALSGHPVSCKASMLSLRFSWRGSPQLVD